MPVNIHGKQYVTVAERVAALHEARNGEAISIETGIQGEDEQQVTVWAKVIVPAGEFWGHARSSKTDRSIEGQSPLEVAETSAVGRALGFAGFGVVEGIATADEIKATEPSQPLITRERERARPEKKPDTPANAVLRKLYALAKEKGMGEGMVARDALHAYFTTDSLKALARHMMGWGKGCQMGHPHNLADEAAGYRVMVDMLAERQEGML